MRVGGEAADDLARVRARARARVVEAAGDRLLADLAREIQGRYRGDMWEIYRLLADLVREIQGRYVGDIPAARRSRTGDQRR